MAVLGCWKESHRLWGILPGGSSVRLQARALCGRSVAYAAQDHNAAMVKVNQIVSIMNKDTDVCLVISSTQTVDEERTWSLSTGPFEASQNTSIGRPEILSASKQLPHWIV
jgi:hypothetical protein